MRTLIAVTLASLIVAACDREQPTPPTGTGGWAKSLPATTQPVYRPAHFRADVERLIRESRYEDAVLYLATADPAAQAAHDAATGGGYLAVAWFAIVLPGVDDVDYDRACDWCFPGTQDAIEHAGWQGAAHEFAERVNRLRAVPVGAPAGGDGPTGSDAERLAPAPRKGPLP